MLAYLSGRVVIYQNKIGFTRGISQQQQKNSRRIIMDYLFYGSVTISRQANTATVSLRINCEADETLNLYTLSPNVSRQLVYNSLPIERFADHIIAQFDVED